MVAFPKGKQVGGHVVTPEGGVPTIVFASLSHDQLQEAWNGVCRLDTDPKYRKGGKHHMKVNVGGVVTEARFASSNALARRLLEAEATRRGITLITKS